MSRKQEAVEKKCKNCQRFVRIEGGIPFGEILDAANEAREIYSEEEEELSVGDETGAELSGNEVSDENLFNSRWPTEERAEQPGERKAEKVFDYLRLVSREGGMRNCSAERVYALPGDECDSEGEFVPNPVKPPKRPSPPIIYSS